MRWHCCSIRPNWVLIRPWTHTQTHLTDCSTGPLPDANDGRSAADGTSGVVLAILRCGRAMHHWDQDDTHTQTHLTDCSTGPLPDANDGRSAADGTSGVVLSAFRSGQAMHHWDPDYRLWLKPHPVQEMTHVNLRTTARLRMKTNTHKCTIGQPDRRQVKCHFYLSSTSARKT